MTPFLKPKSGAVNLVSIIIPVILLSILNIFPGYAQYQKILDFEKLTMDEGLTSNKANVIIQDSKGFIWIGTWNGLNRYDGYSTEIYRPSYHDSTTINNREILALLEDHKGQLWIGTTSGLNCLDPLTRKIKRYSFQNRIISLLEDSNHDIWAGTWNGGLFKLDPESGQMEHLFTNDLISDIYEDSRKNLWIATYYGLINYDRSTSGYTRYLPDPDNPQHSIAHSVVTQIVESDDGNLWLGSWGGGLSKIVMHQNRDSLKFIHYQATRAPGSLTSNVIYRLHYDNYGNLWIGTWDRGLNLLDRTQQQLPPATALFSTYVSDLSNPYSVSGNNISALYVDRSGELWVGSSRIDHTNIIETGIARFKIARYTDGAFVENSIRSFGLQDSYLWAGTAIDLKLYDLKNNRIRLVKEIKDLGYRSGNTNYKANSVLSILSNRDGLWVGTDDAGLILYPGKSAIEQSNPGIIFFNTETSPALPGNKISNIVQSDRFPDKLWIGTMQNGFASLEYKNGKVSIETYSAGSDDGSVTDNNIRAVLEDREGKVWIGTQNGLNCYDPEKRTFQKFFSSISDSTSINDNVINVLYEDTRGNLWIGTNLGLNKKISERDTAGIMKIQFKGYPDTENLNDEIISNILEDNSGNLWLGLYRGLIKFNIEHDTISKEYFIKEYQHLVSLRGSSIKTAEGILFFGGGSGLISFYSDSLMKNSVPPEVCITDLLVFNKSINEKSNGDKGDGTFKAIPYLDAMDLSYKDRILTFVFSAMDYKDPKKNVYSYLLEGFDDNWNNVGTRNTATYTNIKPGNYIFKVKAANSDGVWNEEPVSMAISISPPLWRTKVAFILYGIIFIGLLYFFNQYSIIGVREKGRIMIEHMQYEKEHELNELKSRFFTNITHEFRTPLTLIMGPADELMKSNELNQASRKQAELIHRNAQRLLRLVNQLMEFRKVEKGKMEIYLRKADVVTLLNDLYDSFKSMADSKNIDFSLVLKTPHIYAMLDYEKFEKVMFNLVSNAFKYSEDGGKITIRAGLEDQDRKLVVEVEDTGIGIAEEHKERVFERFFQAHPEHTQSTGGVGLFLSRNFIKLLGGEIGLESELGKGSCFRVVVPTGQEKKIITTPVADTDETDMDIKIAGAGTAPDVPESAESEEDAVFQDRNIPLVLIVEDDSELNEFIVSGLSSDFKTVGSFNGREGLETARKINPDIIVTDIMMPEMDGFELCRHLRKDLATSHIPVVYLTAKTMREDEIEGLKLGAVDYIYKPFNLVSLKLKIKNILQNRKSLQEKFKVDKLIEPEHIELSSLDEKFLKDAVEAVNNYLDDPAFDVDKFSMAIGISSNQAYRKIKALTGQTAKEFIRNQRLKTSASMLLQKKRSISEIIYMVGFSSPSYFTRCFKEYYGCTPKEYIENDGRV